MSRFTKRPIAAAAVLMFSGSGCARAADAYAAGSQGHRHAGQRLQDRIDVDRARRRHAAARHPAVHEHRAGAGDPPAGRSRRCRKRCATCPGITFTAAEGGVSASQIFWLRGFPAGGDLFLDAVRDIGEYNRDLFNIDRIEVLKGPSALAFGRGSTGGVINQVTKIADLAAARRGRIAGRDQRRASRHRRRELRHQPEHGVPLPAAGREAPIPIATRSTTTRSASRRRSASASAPISTSPCNTSICRPRPRRTTASRTSAPTFGYAMPPVSLKQYYGFANYDFTNYHTNIATATVNWKVSDTVERCAT